MTQFLYADTVSMTQILYADTVSMTQVLYADTVSMTQVLNADTVSMNNLFHKIIYGITTTTEQQQNEKVTENSGNLVTSLPRKGDQSLTLHLRLRVSADACANWSHI